MHDYYPIAGNKHTLWGNPSFVYVDGLRYILYSQQSLGSISMAQWFQLKGSQVTFPNQVKPNWISIISKNIYIYAYLRNTHLGNFTWLKFEGVLYFKGSLVQPRVRDASKFPKATWGLPVSPKGNHGARQWVARFIDTKELHSKPTTQKLASNFMFKMVKSARLGCTMARCGPNKYIHRSHFLALGSRLGSPKIR